MIYTPGSSNQEMKSKYTVFDAFILNYCTVSFKWEYTYVIVLSTNPTFELSKTVLVIFLGCFKEEYIGVVDG